MSRDPLIAATQFFGGRVCLDFANTMDWRTSDAPQELIPGYPALLTWCGNRRTLPAAAIGALRARETEPEATAALEQAHALRHEIWNVVEALLHGRPVPLAPLNRRLADVPAQPRLAEEGSAYLYDLPGARLEETLWPVLWSLTALIASDDARRLGSCQADGCGWYFVDESPNRTRVWCSSEVCGNRERARRAYAKRRARPVP
ncbi:MAG TPA: ABATE domain-containing protein [Aliidongia sp.]|uniref:CGNR zinc finger domain-containing protein n=1 Tax=Aliidongia sp. TaxID=1914230 RepID=UPI002DDD3155|nr:ABATE domain-containing protein [Aliidongia sp.]HEV2674270.1 ABATE domain-containing protein [Aliidongia sp.]